MAVCPARREAQRASTPHPAALTAPIPVTTTRLGDGGALPIGRARGHRRAALGHELGQGGDAGEDAAVDLVALDGNAELLLEGDHQLEGVHGVEAEAFSEKGVLVADAIGRQAFEVEARDDELLDPGSSRGLVQHQLSALGWGVTPGRPDRRAGEAGGPRWALSAGGPPGRRRARCAAEWPLRAASCRPARTTRLRRCRSGYWE